jgi:hypothetical protein
MFPIASAYGANIYNGSIVSIVAGGTIQIVTTNGDPISGAAFPAGTIGVFVGCSFTNPTTKQKQFSQYWPTGTVASDAVAYVVDDDRAVFQVQSAGSLVAADLGANVYLNAVQSTTTGSTTTGNSNTAVVATASVITTTAAFRIVGFVDMQGFSTVGDAYTDVLVKFNPGYHSYSNAVGI